MMISITGIPTAISTTAISITERWSLSVDEGAKMAI